MFVDQRTTGRRPRVFHAPDSLDEAAGLLHTYAGNARLAAGATYVMLMASQGEVQPEHLISLHRILGLDELAPGRVGALTTLRRLERGPLTGPERALTMGASVAAGPLVRTLGTIGGNVGFLDGDVIAPLMALDAVAWLDDGTRAPVADFVTERPPDRIITAFEYGDTVADGWSAATVKLAHRAMDWPIVTVAVAVRLEDGIVTNARVAAQALGPTPMRLPAVESVLVGSSGEPEAIEYAGEAACHRVDVRDDAEASAPYRRRVAPAVVGRAAALAIGAGPDGEVPVREAWR